MAVSPIGSRAFPSMFVVGNIGSGEQPLEHMDCFGEGWPAAPPRRVHTMGLAFTWEFRLTGGVTRRFLLRPVSVLIVATTFALAGCVPSGSVNHPVREKLKVSNPVLHFEIPVTDMDRAVGFYEAVFGFNLRREKVDGYDMAFFPQTDGAPGASGALAKGDVYVPSTSGPIIYFNVASIDPVLERARTKGATILYSKKHIGEAGYVAEFEDSEGNRIALSAIDD